MLSNTCKYAIRAVVYLAVNEDNSKRIGIKKISEDLDIPTPFLGKILQSLARQKLLKSTKGPNGGFGLNGKAEALRLIDIVKVIDGNDIFEQCLISLRTCKDEEDYCPMHKSYVEIRSKIKAMFESQTVADLAANYKTDQKILL
ncbi:MAG: RrF2 family transcriptional regulator [Cyclobacteriaceae bacterium]